MPQQPLRYLLIVDDEEAIRAAVRLLFEDEDYVVSEARNGRDALAMLQRTPHPHVVLTDINMPVMDGATLLTTIHADPALARQHAYCIMTAQDATLPIAITRLMGSIRIRLIAKPFDISRLLAVVEAAHAQLTASS